MFIPFRCSFILYAWAVLTWADAAADSTPRQVSTDNYARAEALLPDRIEALVLNERVAVHWLGQRDEFWYRRETATGHEFVIVNAASGRKRAAFDHRALAAALSASTGQSVDAANLPFDAFDLAGADLKRLSVQIAGKSYVCELSRARCEAHADAHAPDGVITSPDGRWAAFTRDSNVWLRNIESGDERALTSDGQTNFGYGLYPDGWQQFYVPRERFGMSLPPFETQWSPDSRRLIVSRVDQRHVAVYPFVENVPRDGSFRPKLHSVRIPLVGERPPTLEWFAFDIPSGAQRRIEYPYEKLLTQQQSGAICRTWWGPQGDRLFAAAFGDNMESAALYVADVATGKVRTVIEESLAPRTDLSSSSYDPPNVRVTQDGREAIWFSQRDGWGHLYLYDVASGTLKNRITAGDWLVRDIVKVDERRRLIYFTAGGREPGNPYYRYLYRINFDGSGLLLLSPEPGDHLIDGSRGDALDEVISPSGRYVVYNVSPLDQTTRTLIRRTADAGLVATIEQADATRLFAAGYRAPEEFVVKAADGKSDLYGVMYKPADFDPARKYAVVDHQYASPLTAAVPRSFVQSLQGVTGYGSPASTAQLGFIVVVIDARGTSYRSREFSHAGYGHLNTNGLDDHMVAIRQLAQRHAFIDVERVGLTGASYGGWSTLRAMIEFPEFYKVGVAGVPPGSLHTMYLDYHWTAFQGRPRYSDGGELRPNATEAPGNWSAANSLQQAGRIKGKLLIIMGELDENVPPGSSLQFVNALMSANRDFDLVYLPDTNHFESRRPYTIRRTWDFLVRHLQGQEPPPYEIK